MFQKRLSVKVTWIPSHLKNNPKKKPIPDWVQKWHIDANEVVDALASQAAAAHQVPMRCLKTYFKFRKLLKPIQARAASIVQNLEFPNKPKSAKFQGFSLDVLTLATDHNLVEDDDSPGVLCCIDCLARVPRNSRSAADFLKSKCDKTLYDKPVGYIPLVITIGNQITHPTHTLKLYGGIFLCVACGSVARSKLCNLGRPCLPPTTAGINNLKAYKKGMRGR